MFAPDASVGHESRHVASGEGTAANSALACPVNSNERIPRPWPLWLALLLSAVQPAPSAYGAWFAAKAAADMWGSAFHGGSGLGLILLVPLSIFAGALAVTMAVLAVAWLVAIGFAMRPLDRDEAWTAGPLMAMHAIEGALFAVLFVMKWLQAAADVRWLGVVALSATSIGLLEMARKRVQPEV